MVLLLAATIAASAQAAQSVQYDVYKTGIRVAELSAGARTWTIRKRDPASNVWSRPVTGDLAQIAEDPAFALWGAIRNLPSRVPSIAKLDWQNTELLGWPDRNKET